MPEVGYSAPSMVTAKTITDCVSRGRVNERVNTAQVSQNLFFPLKMLKEQSKAKSYHRKLQSLIHCH